MFAQTGQIFNDDVPRSTSSGYPLETPRDGWPLQQPPTEPCATAPSCAQEVLQYLLDTVTDDLAYEITRVRPYINDAFWAHLDKLMEEERMKEDYSEAGGVSGPPFAPPPAPSWTLLQTGACA